MKKILLVVSLALAACHSHPHDSSEENERPALSFTNWTDKSELFIELPALVVGQESPCAAHITVLDGFQPPKEGSVVVLLQGGGADERFESKKPTVPGIFRPVVKPARAGRRRLIVEVQSPALSARHDLGEVDVFPTLEAAVKSAGDDAEPGGRIAFLKEQQWPIDFATEIIAERPVRPTLRAPARLRARSDGEVLVTAPAAGRVATNNRAFPRLGEQVQANDTLALLSPRLDAADLASLELAVTSSQLELRFAEREKQRLEGLQSEGAVPERRVLDASRAYDEAQASLTAAQRRLDQFRRVQQTNARGEGVLQLRAPVTGTVTEVVGQARAFVEAGAPLFRVTDLTQLWLEISVPETDVGLLGNTQGATFLAEGANEFIELPPESFLARGQRVDSTTHSVSVLFAVDNTASRFPVGTFAQAYLTTGEGHSALTVPEGAIVDDSGVFVVFIQIEGEAFERRVVKLGLRERSHVEVLSGVQPGEHVVTRGAWSVKLASAGGSVPAHGHAH